MFEGLDHWPFIAAAYALTIAATGGLVIWSVAAMRLAEKRRERSRER